jgi:hypothetical protein
VKYEISLSLRAQQNLDGLGRDTRERMLRRIDGIAEAPHDPRLSSPLKERTSSKQDHQMVAIIKMPQAPGRPIDECIAIARARNSQAALDEGFAADLEEIIASRRPLDTSAWE